MESAEAGANSRPAARSHRRDARRHAAARLAPRLTLRSTGEGSRSKSGCSAKSPPSPSVELPCRIEVELETAMPALNFLSVVVPGMAGLRAGTGAFTRLIDSPAVESHETTPCVCRRSIAVGSPSAP